jgi:hypothetical protein
MSRVAKAEPKRYLRLGVSVDCYKLVINLSIDGERAILIDRDWDAGNILSMDFDNAKATLPISASSL